MSFHLSGSDLEVSFAPIPQCISSRSDSSGGGSCVVEVDAWRQAWLLCYALAQWIVAVVVLFVNGMETVVSQVREMMRRFDLAAESAVLCVRRAGGGGAGQQSEMEAVRVTVTSGYVSAVEVAALALGAVENAVLNAVESAAVKAVETVSLNVVEPVALRVVGTAAQNDVATAALGAVEPTAVEPDTSVSGGQDMDSETNGTIVAACNPMGNVSLGAAVEKCVGVNTTNEPSDVVLIQQVLEVAELAMHHAVNECVCGAYVNILPVVNSLEAGVRDVDSLCEMVQVVYGVELECQCKCALKALDVVQTAIQHCVHKLMDADTMEQPGMGAVAVQNAVEQPGVKPVATVVAADAAVKPLEADAVAVKPLEADAVAVKPVEAGAVAVKPVEADAVAVKPVEADAVAVKPVEADAVAVKPVEADAVAVKPVEANAVALKPVEADAVAVKPVEADAVAVRPVEATAVCEPSVSEPMEPAVCESSVFEPMEPAVCEPSVSEPMGPAVCESSVSEPMEPAVCESSVSEPMEPAVCEPSVSEPMEPTVCESSVSEPMEPAVCESSVSEPMGPAVCKMPISEPAVFETLASEPARYKLPMSEPTEQSTIEQAAMTVMSLLSKVDAAVTALEVTMENEILEGRVKQPAMDAVTDQYSEQLNNWKLQTRSDGKQAIMEIMDAMSGLGKDTQQPMVDAVEKCGMVKQPFVDAVIRKANSWDTKRKNVQKARKRRMQSARDGEGI